jgi:hypothetical protein
VSPAALPQPAASTAADQASLRWWLLEVVWLFLMCFLFAGSPPPDAGESHYLVKARHYWDPAWCAGELFLESDDAHFTYYWTFGWLTRLFPLAACAWIGRAVTWGLIALAWRRLSFAIVPRPLWSLLSMGLLLLLSRNFNWAREIAVGGFEAKTIAYGLVFLALADLAYARWRAALLWIGAASAFHVLVGGWSGIALAIAWLLLRLTQGSTAVPRVARLAPAATLGLVLALPGLLPNLSLMQGVPAETSRLAARIYVFSRLPHHLVFHSFGTWYWLRHSLMLCVWAGLAIWCARASKTAASEKLATAATPTHQPHLAGLVRLNAFLLGALAIAAIGAAIDLVPLARVQAGQWSYADYQLAVAPLLRLYWFRLADALTPAVAALAISAVIATLVLTRPRVGNWLLIGAMVLAGVNLGDVWYWRSQVRVPDSVIQQRPTFDSRPRWWLDEPRSAGRMYRPLPGSSEPLTAREWLAYWQDTCAWIEANTPPDAKFLTPRRQQTFKWYAGRAEVASWKDIPQDARSIVAWRELLRELYPPEPDHWEADLAAFTDEELVALAKKHNCQYIVVDRTRSSRRIGLPSVYPLFREQNPAFEVFRVP